MDNLKGGRIKDTISKCMSTMFGYAYNMSNLLNGIGWEGNINIPIVNLLPEMETKEDANIRRISI